MAALDPNLARDTIPLGVTGLCWLRWMNDQRFPWLVLVPRRDDVGAWHHLPAADQHGVLDEMSVLARALEAVAAPDKINVGALGNRVPQFHLHVLARYRDDPCWPGPVWGQGEARPFEPGAEPAWLKQLLAALPQGFLEIKHD